MGTKNVSGNHPSFVRKIFCEEKMDLAKSRQGKKESGNTFVLLPAMRTHSWFNVFPCKSGPKICPDIIFIFCGLVNLAALHYGFSGWVCRTLNNQYKLCQWQSVVFLCSTCIVLLKGLDFLGHPCPHNEMSHLFASLYAISLWYEDVCIIACCFLHDIKLGEACTQGHAVGLGLPPNGGSPSVKAQDTGHALKDMPSPA
jgi:hypothetical protein